MNYLIDWSGRTQRSVALIGKLTDSAYRSRWCSSGCVHRGCGGVHRWLKTEKARLSRILFYRHPGRQAGIACLHPSSRPH
jgi:hypothetical protein